jgi:cephalosporin hydroxylase
LGHRALKNPIDAWVYQEIIYEVKPDIVFEIGNKNGGSTLYLAGILEMMNNGRVLALDIDHSKFTAKHERIDLITGDSTNPEIIERIHEYCDGKTCLIIHDAAHSQEAVITDLRNYCDLVKPLSYIIVEDTCEGLKGFMTDESRDRYKTFTFPHKNTALNAAKQFVQENRRFEIDRSREKWILTSNPYGYLKCITEEAY